MVILLVQVLLHLVCLFILLDDMPPGQTPHTVSLYAYHDLVDAVQPGDRYVVVTSACLFINGCLVIKLLSNRLYYALFLNGN